MKFNGRCENSEKLTERMKVLLLLLTYASVLMAQEDQRTCRILFPGGSEQHAGKHFLFDGADCQEVTLPRLSLSPIYKMRAGEIRIHLLKSPVRAIEEIPLGSPSAILSPDARDIYLLISNDPENRVLPLKMRVVNASDEKIRKGEMLWFNLTQKHVTGKMGVATLNLTANSSAIVKSPATALGDYPVQIDFRVPNDDRIHPLIESQWYHDPRSRSLVFVFDDGKRRAPKIMAFSDFREEEKKSEGR